MKIYPISLGCAKNSVDLEVLLANLNMEITDDFSQADIILINTCAFIEDAKKEAIDTILASIEDKRPKQKIIVSGCLSTRYKGEIEELLPEVDLFISIKDYPKLKEIINNLFNDNILAMEFDINKRLISGSIKSVYVKLSEGCNNRCSYCAIPLIRGSFVSRAKEDIINEVKDLVSQGAYEINLISQDTTNYGFGLYKDYGIVDLLEDLEKIDGDFKIRLLYLYPSLVSDRLIEYIKNSKKVMPYFDIPLQHSESKMLKLMNRHSDKEFNLALLKKIKKEIPNAILRTTFIVGFPEETDEDFNSLIEFVKEIEFDRMGAFIYSKEEGTKGALMENQIPEEVKKERLERLYLAQDEILLKKNKMQIGLIFECLIVEYDYNEYAYLGRSYQYAPDDIDGYIYIYAKDELYIGDVVKVKIIDADLDGLSGEVIDEEN